MGTIFMIIFISVIVGLVAGFSMIYTLNRIPSQWLCDYGEEPDHTVSMERIKKSPWAFLFSIGFMLALIKLLHQHMAIFSFDEGLAQMDVIGLISTILGFFAIWLLLQISIIDKKYLIIPDQHVVAITLVGVLNLLVNFMLPQGDYALVSFLKFDLLSHLAGAFVGGGTFLLIGVLGNLIFKKDAMGFGDIKLVTAIGFYMGLKGILITLLLTIFLSAMIFAILLLLRKIEKEQEQPLGPFIAIGAMVVILLGNETTSFLFQYLFLI